VARWTGSQPKAIPCLASSPPRFAARWPLAGARRSPRRTVVEDTNSPAPGQDETGGGFSTKAKLPYLGDLGPGYRRAIFGAAGGVVEGPQDRKGNGIIRRIGRCVGLKPVIRSRWATPIRAERDGPSSFAARHRCAPARKPSGSFTLGDQIELVLGRMKPRARR